MGNVSKETAWNFALGLLEVDGLKVSDEMLEMIEKEIKGEMTVEDILKRLDEKYSALGGQK